MLTLKGIFLCIIIIILLAVSWNLKIEIFYVLCAISFCILFLGFLYVYLTLPKISIERKVQDVAYEDDLLAVEVKITNKRNIPSFFFEVIDRFEGEACDKKEKSLFVSRLDREDYILVNYTVNCFKRGLHRFGPVSVAYQDMMGFFKIVKRLDVFSEILVYPKLFNILFFPQLKASSLSWMGVETARISSDTHEFFGVREYRRGDLKSRIHWPLTAKHGKLIVKEFQRNAAQEATILLDLKKGNDIGTGKDTTLEYSVKIAASVAAYLLENNIFVQLVGYGKEKFCLPFGKGEYHKHRILEYLAGVTSDGEVTLDKMVDETVFGAPIQSTLVCILSDNDLKGLMSLSQFKTKDIKLIIVLLAASSFGKIGKGSIISKDDARNFEDMLSNMEAYTYRIIKGDKLEEKFQYLS
ncbi:MAG: DUF58 domain-containing protein [Candidatus Omnitrophota bacterium]